MYKLGISQGAGTRRKATEEQNVGNVLKWFLIATAAVFWGDHFLNRFAPACSPGFISIGVPDRYVCVSGHWLRDDPRWAELTRKQ